MFSEFEITKEGFGVDNEIVMDYIEKDLNGTVLKNIRTRRKIY